MPITIVANSGGSAETALYLADAMPADTLVKQAVLQTPAFVYNNDFITYGFIAPPDRRRSLSMIDLDIDGNERKGRARRALRRGRKPAKSEGASSKSKSICKSGHTGHSHCTDPEEGIEGR